jgi:hypothetical protein
VFGNSRRFKVLLVTISTTTIIFIALLNEGTDVWRPVLAACAHDDVYRIIGEQPEGEDWQFLTGEMVRCRQQTFADGETGLVAQEKVANS